MSKPTLCVDFDGVIHSYSSKWLNAAFIPDPPVPGALAWLLKATDTFDVKIYSSRSSQEGGIKAMMLWLEHWARIELPNDEAGGYAANSLINRICNDNGAFPTQKPAAFLTIDDRAICFDGNWENVAPSELLKFKPWNKK